MPQLNKGDTFADGQQVTGIRLNNLIDGATLLVGAITDQPNLTANTLEATDTTIVNDAGTLKEATIGDILNSNLPITTSAVTAGANNDILITPNDGTLVTGQAYTSGDGLTVTVTSTAHILAVGQVILVTAAGTGYNGTFRVATIATNSFTYVMSTAATAGSGTLSYIKKGLVKNPANKSIAGNLYVDGSAVFAGSTTISGATAFSGALTTTGSNTHSGTDNFTGTLQINGAVGYALIEVVEETMTPWTAVAVGNYNSIWTSSSFTKPSNEIWVFEVDYHYSGVSGYAFAYGFRYSDQTAYTGTYKVIQQHYTVGNNGTQPYHQTKRWVEGIGITLTALTLRVDTNAAINTLMTMFLTTYSIATFVGTSSTIVVPSKFRIYKYKTA
jgi:hypothetical protein